VVVLVSELTGTSLAISNQLLTVLGVVLGLVISFRTSTAYERFVLQTLFETRDLSLYISASVIRFSEGRRLWTSLAIVSRHLAQIVGGFNPDQRILFIERTLLSAIASDLDLRPIREGNTPGCSHRKKEHD
jgi:ion channel-forming bestrophin family protein